MIIKYFKSKYDWYFPVLIGIIILLGFASAIYTFLRVDDSGRRSLLYRAETIAFSLDAREISVLTGSSIDVYSPEYLTLKKKLQAIRKANPDSRFVYIMGSKNGKMFFYADSENPDSEDYSAPGDEYNDHTPAFEQAFDKGESGTEGPISDEFGRWVTGVAPIKDSEGIIIAAVGIDVDASNYTNRAIAYAIIPLLLSILLSVFAFAGLKIHSAEKKWLDLKAQFVTLASHELRSPLTGLLWAHSSLAKNESLSLEHRKTVEEMRRVTAHLLEAVNDILDATTMEKGVSLEKEKCDLREMVRSVVRDFSFLSENNDVMVKVELPHEAMIINASKSKLERVFSNLITNAIKYSKRGGDIKVIGKIIGDKYIFSIEDQGIGIPQAEQARIFDGFYRASNVDKTKTKGTGLGMYVVKQIIEAHNGKIKLTSREGLGTKVEITLPNVL